MPDPCKINEMTDDARLRMLLGTVARMPFGMGQGLIDAVRGQDVALAIDPDMEGGLYFCSDDGMEQFCTVGPEAEAGTLAHEMRHAWQRHVMPAELYSPEAPGEALAALRLREADAQAVGCYTNMVVWHQQGLTHKQAWARCYTALDRVAVNAYYDDAEEIAASVRNTGIVLRRLFEDALCCLPGSYHYEGLFAQDMERRQDDPDLAPFTRREDDPAVMRAIAQALGRVGCLELGDYYNYVAAPWPMGRPMTASSYADPGVLTGPILARLRGAVTPG